MSQPLNKRPKGTFTFNRYGALALSFEALEPGYWPGLCFALVSGRGTAQVFTVSTVLGSTEGERLAGRATFLTPRRNAPHTCSQPISECYGDYVNNPGGILALPTSRGKMISTSFRQRHIIEAEPAPTTVAAQQQRYPTG